MAKKFFYVCAGLFMLVGAYAIGANGVEAQVGGDFAGLTSQGGYLYTVTTMGDVYKSGPAGRNWVYHASVMNGVVNSEASTLGDVKSQYR